MLYLWCTSLDIINLINPNGPELLESLKLPGWGGGQMAPPSELTNYNLNAKTDVTLYSQL